jgi:hypothetical protein
MVRHKAGDAAPDFPAVPDARRAFSSADSGDIRMDGPPDIAEVERTLARLSAEAWEIRASAAQTVRDLWRLQAQSQHLRTEARRLLWELGNLQVQPRHHRFPGK